MNRNHLLLTVALMLPFAVYAACARDTPPVIPLGDYATEGEMLDAQQALNAYIANNNVYLECLDAESAETSEDESAAETQARAAAYIDAVDEMVATTREFNEEMRAFRTPSL